MDITALPFNRLVGIERSANEGTVLGLPAGERYTNHLGTVHAGALLALAEATSGECLIAGLRGLGFEVVPVVRRIEAKFRKAAHGAVHSKLGDTGELMRELREALSAKGRALVAVPVDVFDASGTHALAATVEWFVARSGASAPADSAP
jgi:acyl-coenzyme A thioesterase PaaI-like protein